MTAGSSPLPAPAARRLPFNSSIASAKVVRPSHWLSLMPLLILATSISLALSETPFLAGHPVAIAVRFGLMAFLALMVAFRPRGSAVLRVSKRFDGLALLFVGLAFTSGLYSASPSLTVLRSTSSLFLYVAVFWTIWFYADLAGGEKVASILLLTVAIVFVTSVFNIFISPSAWLSGRFRGVMTNPNAIGMLTILFMPLAVVYAMRTRRLSAYFLIAVMLASVVLSGSRNGVMTTSLSLAFLALRLKAWKTGRIMASLAVALYLVLPDHTPSPGIAAKPLTHLLSNEKLMNGGGRVEAWQVAVPIIQDKIILGHGFGTEELIFKGMKFRVHRGGYIHNSYLGLTYQLGLVGSFLIFLPLLGLLVYRLRGHGFVSPQTAAYEALLFGGLIASLFESWIYSAGNAFAFPFWVCVMLLTRAAMGVNDGFDTPRAPKRTAYARRLVNIRSQSPVVGPVNGLAPVLSANGNSTRPAPRRFDPPALRN